MAEVLLSEAEKTFILHGVEVSYEYYIKQT
jgi:hypothetical protein